MSQKLSELIASHNLPLGTTEDGKMYALKALHPADPVAESHGIPTGESQPIVVQNYQMTASLSPPGADEAKNGWDCTIVFLPHPVVFGYAVKSYMDGTSSSITYFINSQLLGTDIAVDYNVLTRRFTSYGEAYRLAYWGMTGNFDAPALSNQGVLVAAQYPLEHRKVSISRTQFPDIGTRVTGREPSAPAERPLLQPSSTARFLASGEASRLQGVFHDKVHYVPDLPLQQTPSTVGHPDRLSQAMPPNMPNTAASLAWVFVDDMRPFDALINMPNAYSAEAKYGFYAPGQLDNTHKHWRSTVDRVVVMGVTDAVASFGTRADDYVAASLPLNSIPSAPFGCYGPSGADWGQMMHKLAQENVVQVSCRNLSLHSSWSFVLRYGFEMKVGPGSSISMFQQLGATRDEVALKAVLEFFRRFKHAYPADYNDLSKILKVIGGIANTVVPMLPWPAAKLIGGIAGTALSGAGEYISQRSAAKVEPAASVRDKMPEATIDAIRKAISLRSARQAQVGLSQSARTGRAPAPTGTKKKKKKSSSGPPQTAARRKARALMGLDG